MFRPAPRNLITDIAGLEVGHATDEKVRSGVTALLCTPGWMAAVDVRGGGPGTRETDALASENLVGRAHAIVLAGGSVFGLAAADGVAALLSSRGTGLALRPGSPAIPIVPAAVLHDLSNGGDKNWGLDPPYRALGLEAAAAAAASASDEFALGAVGAGRGAMAGFVKGGIGSTSIDLGHGLIVGALVALNSVGSPLMPDGKTYWAWPYELDREFGGRGAPKTPMDLSDPAPDQSRLLQIGRLQPGANTTLAVVACNADLSSVECRRMAMMAHDGIARAVRPAHTPFDGDTIFALASGALPLSGVSVAGRVSVAGSLTRPAHIARIGSAAADCLTRAIGRAVHLAEAQGAWRRPPRSNAASSCIRLFSAAKSDNFHALDDGCLSRRDFVRLGLATLIATGAGKLRPAFARMPAPGQGPGSLPHPMLASEPKASASAADFMLRIAPMIVELAPRVAISTIGYSDKIPGPLLRVREGQRVSVEVVNDTDVPEYVHWHGLFVPSDVDGAEEEGTPPVPPHGRRRYQFVAKPAGSRWYHSHTEAMLDLHRGSYTGQFGFLMIDSANDPGRYDQEVFLALREWQPYLTTADQDDMAADPDDPMPEKPAAPDQRLNGLEVGAPLYSINDKMLGAGEPLRVRPGERVLMHLLNASASQIHRIGLFGHHFLVTALDGNPVPTPQTVDVIEIAPGERVDAIVEMNLPGVWILGELRDAARQSGLGIVVEYANQAQPRAQWIAPAKARWDYTIFGKPAPHPPPDETIDMVFEKVPGGPHGFNHWLVNGKEYPHGREFVLRRGGRYRLVFHNRSDDSHPLHMHRHVFELIELNGKPTAGIMKDTVIVPAFGRATVDLVADQPGLSLFHCHIQHHMDFGFKALFRYA